MKAKFLFVLGFAFVISAQLLAQSPAGRWVGEIPAAGGGTTQVLLEFQAVGTSLTGSISFNNAMPTPIHNGKINGDTITFEASPGAAATGAGARSGAAGTQAGTAGAVGGGRRGAGGRAGNAPAAASTGGGGAGTDPAAAQPAGTRGAAGGGGTYQVYKGKVGATETVLTREPPPTDNGTGASAVANGGERDASVTFVTKKSR